MVQILTPNYGMLQNLPQPSPVAQGLAAFYQAQANQRAQQLAPLQRQYLAGEIALEPSKQLLTQAQAIHALAQAKTAGTEKQPDILTKYNAYQQAFTENPHSAKTQVLASSLQKDLQKTQGITQTTTPEGTTTLQIGGSTTPAQPTTTQITPGEVLHPTHAIQATQNAIDTQQQQMQQLFPPQPSQAELADQKQLGENIKNIGNLANTATDHTLPLLQQLRQAVNDLGNKSGPVIGRFAWTTPEGQRLQQLLARRGQDIMQTVHNIRTQREFNMMMRGMGNTNMFQDVLKKTVNDALDEQYQNVLKQDFFRNYLAQGGKSSSEANSLWSKILTTGGINDVPDKYLNFKVSGSNRNYKDYIKTVKDLVKKNPKNKALNNLPIISLVREDLQGGM